jgi:FtsH-binding integral membrane protein
MALSKTDYWDDIAFLVVYCIISPFAFGFFNSEDVHGEGMVIFIAILFITAITLFCSAIIIYFIRRDSDSRWKELYSTFTMLVVSTLVYVTVLSPTTPTSTSLFIIFLKSNTTEIAFLYIFRKLFSE